MSKSEILAALKLLVVAQRFRAISVGDTDN